MKCTLEKALNMKLIICIFKQLSDLKINFHKNKSSFLAKPKRCSTNIEIFSVVRLGMSAVEKGGSHEPSRSEHVCANVERSPYTGVRLGYSSAREEALGQVQSISHCRTQTLATSAHNGRASKAATKVGLQG
jgi:hypothetical protein